MTIRLNLLKFLLFVCCGVSASQALAQMQTTTISIHGNVNTITLTAEIARTPNEQELGLMGRKALPKHHGMLFPQEKPRRMQMWMKGTLIPLDMVFINAKGRISMTAKNNKPGSLMPVGPSSPVSAVLELPAGSIDELAIAVGDTVEYVLPPSERNP